MPTDRGPLEVALFYDRGCPLAAGLRAEVLRCLTESSIPFRFSEHLDGGRLSPTLLIDGHDLVGGQAFGRGCRLVQPSSALIRAALPAFSGETP